MDELKKKKDLNLRNSFIDRDVSYWWKDEGKWLEMVWPSVEESD